MLLANRRYAAAESVVTRIEALHNEGMSEITDLHSLLAREHGRFRESTRIIQTLAKESPDAAWFMQLIVADNKRLLGDYSGAFQLYEQPGARSAPGPSILPAAPGKRVPTAGIMPWERTRWVQRPTRSCFGGLLTRWENRVPTELLRSGLGFSFIN
jgi:hypothetical protein